MVSILSSSGTTIRCIAWSSILQRSSSSLPTTATTTTSKQQVVRLLSSSSSTRLGRSSYGRVRSYLRERRPVRQGEAVAFHISDLEKPRQVHSQQQQQQQQPRREYESDLIVLLDMDECLIHSQFHANAHSAKVFAHQLLRSNGSSTNGSNTNNGNQVESFQFTLPSKDVVHTFLRPHVAEFLQSVSEHFETHIFTAAMPLYADPILNRLDPNDSIFAGRWYRDSCVFQKDPMAYVKNLQALPLNLDLSRTVLVDNNPLSFLANPTNGILVNSFYQDPQDCALPAVLQILLQQLKDIPDVRPVLEAQFGLEKALKTTTNNLLQQRIKKSTTLEQTPSLAVV